uniref:Farnesoic acid O-methyltransferase n=1 Tax=Schistocerca gregaria TaxID=7010 RepID=E7EAU4_SCHGR|nr:farnesoic acid methyltransferase [Schistocerca gregaria]AEV89769.1 farnesoic acid O-methyltransferase [Schistocerca gregaria]
MAVELQTPDKLEYNFYPVTSGSTQFKVKTPNDAHIALTTGPAETDPMYEIFIGGWGNTKSIIRKNRQKPDKVEVETPGILSGDEFRGFWIRWSAGSIACGKEGEAHPFMSWDDPEPFGIGYYGVCTGWGASGSWLLEAPQPGWSLPSAPSGGAATWVPARAGEVPPGAVPGGYDNEQLYVGRARHEGALIPGKVHPSHGVCYVAWGGQEHGKEEYEVLCGCEAAWVPAAQGQVPEGALPSGETEDGEPLFTGRAQHEGAMCVGKVQASHTVCYIPYGGQEIAYPEYEVLVAK